MENFNQTKTSQLFADSSGGFGKYMYIKNSRLYSIISSNVSTIYYVT